MSENLFKKRKPTQGSTILTFTTTFYRIIVLNGIIGFLLRVMYGGVTINVEVSKWLYLMIIFGSFYLGFGKRRNNIL